MAPVTHGRAAVLGLTRLLAATALSWLAMACWTAAAGDAQRSAGLDIEVKAAYLFNFGRFVRWPAADLAPGAPFRVCVLGTDPFGAALDRTLVGETIDGHPVTARRVTSTTEAMSCHILFVSAARGEDLRPALRALSGAPILTVSDAPDFLSDGGVVQFVWVNNRVRFEINASAAERARLSLGSELARVAVAVRREPPK
jgi:hypothetical protein